MIKAIVLDLDGTLLNRNKEIDELTKLKLTTLKDEIKIVLASARGFYRIERYVDELDLRNSQQITIAYNGSVVLQNDGMILANHPIEIHDMSALFQFIQQHLEGRWTLYGFDFHIPLNEIDHVADFIRENPIYKVVIVATENEIKKMKAQLPEALFQSFEITCSEPVRMEFVKKGFTKVAAIQRMAEHFHLQQEEIAAIGDGENDIAMIEYAQVGIAMQNASFHVKEKADYVTGDCDEHGVANAIDYLIGQGFLE